MRGRERERERERERDSLGADLPDLLHVGEDDMVLPLVQDPPALWQVGVHPWVLHEVLDEHVQTTKVSRFSCHHLKHGLCEQALYFICVYHITHSDVCLY